MRLGFERESADPAIVGLLGNMSRGASRDGS